MGNRIVITAPLIAREQAFYQRSRVISTGYAVGVVICKNEDTLKFSCDSGDSIIEADKIQCRPGMWIAKT